MSNMTNKQKLGGVYTIEQINKITGEITQTISGHNKLYDRYWDFFFDNLNADNEIHLTDFLDDKTGTRHFVIDTDFVKSPEEAKPIGTLDSRNRLVWNLSNNVQLGTNYRAPGSYNNTQNHGFDGTPVLVFHDTDLEMFYGDSLQNKVPIKGIAAFSYNSPWHIRPGFDVTCSRISVFLSNGALTPNNKASVTFVPFAVFEFETPVRIRNDEEVESRIDYKLNFNKITDTKEFQYETMIDGELETRTGKITSDYGTDGLVNPRDLKSIFIYNNFIEKNQSEKSLTYNTEETLYGTTDSYENVTLNHENGKQYQKYSLKSRFYKITDVYADRETILKMPSRVKIYLEENTEDETNN